MASVIMLRTPPGSGWGDLEESPQRPPKASLEQSPQHPPKGKLASVTRKMNKIEHFLQSESPDLGEVRRNFTEYLVRVENLIGSCSDMDGP